MIIHPTGCIITYLFKLKKYQKRTHTYPVAHTHAHTRAHTYPDAHSYAHTHTYTHTHAHSVAHINTHVIHDITNAVKMSILRHRNLIHSLASIGYY